MEKVLIEQLLNSGVSLKKIKTIIENTEKIKEQNLNETVSANTCGLNLVVCSGCHKTMYEDKFMLNKANKRYRSCINCVSRTRTARQNKEQNHVLKNTDKGKVLAILDEDYINIDDEEKAKLEYIASWIKLQKEIVESPSVFKTGGGDSVNLDDEDKASVKQHGNCYNYVSSILITEPQIEPEEVGLNLNFFNTLIKEKRRIAISLL